MNVRDLQHPLLARLTPEEASRQRAVISLRRIVSGRMRGRNLDHYASDGAPAFETAHGHPPATAREMEEALFRAPGYRAWSALARASQEMIWLSVGEPILREEARMRAEAAGLHETPKGSLHLDPGVEPVREIADIDIHLQPGGYALDRDGGDLVAGALYEAGGNIYAFGQGLGKGDSKAGAVIRHLEAAFPDFRPQRILDLGCSAGAASCAWAAHYPDAEVHAVDIGAAMLRYAHARAEALEVAVHFHQGDAASLPAFADGSFDLVLSHNLLHEIGRDQRAGMMREARRLVRPGGLVVHQDVPTRFEQPGVAQVERAWDIRFNGEAFWGLYAGDDLVADMRAAGFVDAEIGEHRLAKVDGPGGWYVLIGERRA